MDKADVINPTILSGGCIRKQVVTSLTPPTDDQLKEFRYAFLVRSPRKAITSYYRATIDNDCGDFGEFDPSEAGFKELHAMMVSFHSRCLFVSFFDDFSLEIHQKVKSR